MLRFNVPRTFILKSRSILLVGICVLVTLSCGSGVIQNFEGIRVHSDPRVDRIDLRIYLVDRNGIPLIWNQSILSPSVGVSTVSEADFTTNAKVYSMRNGKQHKKVYDGRLIDLRWSQELNRLDRLMTAEIPRGFIDEDPERDTHLGVIIVEVQTEKQGPFSDTLERTAIYKY
ncbi:hypothetical protein C6500_03905 [Candidatus Poribacteria bacterium]|nr:MAG: hypothetical protein C6500_03905 [Candidatus Poribacteria bacterium]